MALKLLIDDKNKIIRERKVSVEYYTIPHHTQPTPCIAQKGNVITFDLKPYKIITPVIHSLISKASLIIFREYDSLHTGSSFRIHLYPYAIHRP